MSFAIDPIRLPRAPEFQSVFRVLADALPQMVWLTRDDGTIEYMNRAWTRFTGLDQTEVSPEDWRRAVHPDDFDQAVAAFSRARDANEGISIEFRLRGRDGAYRWFRSRSEVLWDADGRAFRRLGSAVDVDDTKKLQAQIDEYLTLTETIPAFVWLTDSDGRMLYSNSRWAEFTGYPAEKIDRAVWRSIIHPEDSARTRERWEAAGRDGKPYEAEFRIRGRNGEYRWILRHSAPVLDGEGRVVKWIGVALDIDVPKRLEADLRSAIATRDQFLAVCSHELKTPITLMELNAESFRRKVLRDEPSELTPERLAKYFDRLSPHLKRLNQRINDMFDVSRIAAGQLEIRREKSDLGRIARSALESLRPRIELSECPVDFRAEDGVGCECDPARIEQVIANLIDNALKYGRGKPIEIRVRSGPGIAVFEIVDQGPGVPAADRDRIFRKFERAAESAGISGLGLGLHIASEIVAAHSGTISVGDSPGKGSVFTVSLPAPTAS